MQAISIEKSLKVVMSLLLLLPFCQSDSYAIPVATQSAPASPSQTSSKTPYPFVEVIGYTAVLEALLEKGWHPQFSPVKVIFRVSERGDVSGLQVYSSSGDTKLDEKALSVVRSCSPFPKPPAGALPLDVQYTFK